MLISVLWQAGLLLSKAKEQSSLEVLGRGARLAVLLVIDLQLTLCTKIPGFFLSTEWRQPTKLCLCEDFSKSLTTWFGGGGNTLFSSFCCLSAFLILAQRLSTNLADWLAIKDTWKVLKAAASDLKSAGMRVETKCKEQQQKKGLENLAPFPDR